VEPCTSLSVHSPGDIPCRHEFQNENQCLVHGMSWKEGPDIHFVQCQVEETANGYGGAGIFAKEGVTVSLSGWASVKNNRANQCGGGGIRISHGTALSLSEEVVVSGNWGDMGGGIFAEQKSAVSIADNVRFEQNVAFPNGGGAIHISGLAAQSEFT
jgi:hypothetical protein